MTKAGCGRFARRSRSAPRRSPSRSASRPARCTWRTSVRQPCPSSTGRPATRRRQRVPAPARGRERRRHARRDRASTPDKHDLRDGPGLERRLGDRRQDLQRRAPGRLPGPPARVLAGIGARGIAVNEATNTIYVANTAANTVSVIDGANCDATVESGCGQTRRGRSGRRQPPARRGRRGDEHDLCHERRLEQRDDAERANLQRPCPRGLPRHSHGLTSRAAARRSRTATRPCSSSCRRRRCARPSCRTRSRRPCRACSPSRRSARTSRST